MLVDKFQRGRQVARKNHDTPETLGGVSLASPGHYGMIVDSPIIHTDENNRLPHFDRARDDNCAVVTFPRYYDKNCQTNRTLRIARTWQFHRFQSHHQKSTKRAHRERMPLILSFLVSRLRQRQEGLTPSWHPQVQKR